MKTTVAQFVESLGRSKLLPDDEVQTIVGDLTSPSQTEDARGLAQSLVQQQKLTPYQATAVYQGKLGGLGIGNYVVLNRIGAGGMGTVFKAEHRVLKRIVAIKVLPRKFLADANAVRRFRREVRAAAQLEHPNIVRAFDADEAGGVHFLVMEYVDGKDLSQYVKRHGPLSVEAALGCILQAARGLEHAHAKGIIHRDVKPANLLLDTSGTVKVLDMGLARLESTADYNESLAQSTLTSPGTVMGTVDYMAPEQALDSKLIDHRADIYSLGYTLFYLLTRKKAYRGDTLMQILMAHQQQPIPSLQKLRPEVPDALEAVYRKMVAKDRGDRYQSMSACVAALESVLREVAAAQQEANDSRTETLAVTSAEQEARENFQHFLQGLEVDATPTLILPSGESSSESAPTDPATTEGAPSSFPVSPLQQTLSWTKRRPLIATGITAAVLLLGVIIWSFSGGHRDEPENGRADSAAGTQAGNKALGTPIELLPNYALSFDGEDDYVEIPTLTYDGSHPITIEAQVSPANLKDVQYVVANTRAAGNTGGLALKLGKRDPTVAWGLYFGMQDQQEVNIFGPRAIQGVRVHLAMVVETNRARLFVNGQLANEQNFFGLHAGSAIPFTFAGPRKTPEGSLFFRGLIDEVRVSNVARYTEDFTPKRRFEPDEHTLALYHFDEGNGDVLKDASGNGHHGKIEGATWVKADGSPIQPPPNYALEFGGVTASVEIPDLTLPANSPCTLEAWVRQLEPCPSGSAWSVLAVYGAPNANLTGASSWKFAFQQRSDAAGTSTEIGTTYHLAGVWDGGECRLFVNGEVVGMPYNNGSDPKRIEELGAGTLIGAHFYQKGRTGKPFRGIIDEVRISKAARYSEDFTPAKRFEPDEDTLALYHFDEGRGEVLKDSSGNNHHGKIVGAKWVRVDDDLRVIEPIDAAADPQRRAAEAVLRLGGTVGLRTWEKAWTVTDVDQLPQGRFALGSVEVAFNQRVSDETLYQLRGIGSLDYLVLARTPVTDNGLEHLRHMESLREVNLNTTRVTDQGIPQLAVLSNLRHLNLTGTSIGDEACRSLAELSDLRSLRLASTSVSDDGVKELAGLKGLHLLSIRDTAVTTRGLIPLQSHETLQILDLRDTVIDDAAVDVLAEFQGLRLLDVRGTQLTPTGATGLQSRLPRCNVLHDSLPVSESERELGKWVLEHEGRFGVWSTEVVDALPDKPFAIWHFNIADEHWPPISLVQGLRSLKSINFPADRDADAVAEQLGKLDSLESVNFSDTNLSEVGLRRLQGLNQLEFLWANHCQRLDDAALAELAAFPYLRFVSLDGTPITDDGLAHLAKIDDLQQLFLGNCPQIGGEGLRHLENSPKLRYLHLAGTPITDEAAVHLKRMTGLRVLNIARTEITAQAALDVQNALPGCVVFHESLDGVPWPLAPPPMAVAPFDEATAKQHQQAWADHLGLPVEREVTLPGGEKLTMILIPPGEFMMGSTNEERKWALETATTPENRWAIQFIRSEGPRHRVRVTQPFWLSRHETTFGQFRQFVEETNYTTDAERDGQGGFGWLDGQWTQNPRFVWNGDLGFTRTDDHPVVNVSWNDAEAFCRWLSKEQEGLAYRLPSETQWEYACRAGTTTYWHWGDSEAMLRKHAWFVADSGGKTHLVGGLRPNRFGLYDMHGNVFEWCADWFAADYYARSPVDDPPGPPAGSRRVLRGGDWNSPAVFCRSAYRSNVEPDFRSNMAGFRVAQPISLTR